MCQKRNCFITLNYYPNDIWYLRRRYDLNCKSANVVYRLECILCGLVYVGETKGKLHKRYAVIDPVSLTMLTILFTSILINLTTRSFQCEFVLSECSQHKRIITSRNRKPWLGTLGSLLYTWILSWIDVLSSAHKLLWPHLFSDNLHISLVYTTPT
jgi:hypothetical protein